jgi:hypothetical protein
MWGRVVEMMFAVWLGLSPFIFGVQSDLVILWGDLTIGFLICLCSGLAYYPPLRYAHLMNLVIAVGLILWGRFYVTPPTPPHENHIVIGLLLLLVAIIPNEASLPPQVWRKQPA